MKFGTGWKNKCWGTNTHQHARLSLQTRVRKGRYNMSWYHPLLDPFASKNDEHARTKICYTSSTWTCKIVVRWRLIPIIKEIETLFTFRGGLNNVCIHNYCQFYEKYYKHTFQTQNLQFSKAWNLQVKHLSYLASNKAK